MPKKSTAKKPTKKTARKKAVSSVSAPDVPNRSETMSIRKISNGWLVTKDSYNQSSGKFASRETFTKTKPKLEIKI